MFKSIAVNSIAAVVAAALVAGLAVSPTSIVPEAKADAFRAPLLQLAAVATAPVCSLQGWPHYEQGCQFDLRAPAGETRTVRVIALR